MIISRVTDGLGNQMFQYALGRRLALKHNTELALDLCWYKDRSAFGGTDREFTLKNFDINARIATKEDIESVIPFGSVGRRMIHTPRIMDLLVDGRSPISRLDGFLTAGINRRRLAESYNYAWEYSKSPESQDPHWAYRRRFYEPVLEFGDNLYLHGYWQSFKYIEDIKDKLREEFTPKNMNRDIKRVSKEIAESNSVAVHIRRGDFIQQGPGEGNLLPRKYYERSRNLIEEREEDVEYYIFSDNPDWAAKNRFQDERSTHVSHEYRTEEHEDLYLMSMCKNNINANSTFSVWSSWLNNNEKKKVLIPSPWKKYGYPDGVVQEWDLFPESWKVIAY
jgi:hypothetical protein